MMQTAPETPSVESVLNAPWPLPLWLSILIVAGLTTMVAWIYLSERGTANRSTRIALATLRLLLLGLVLWMLAGWSWLRFNSDPPELVVVLDRSASMDTRDVSPAKSAGQAEELTRFERALGLFHNLTPRQRHALQEQYRLKWFAVADTVQPLNVDLNADSAAFESLAATGNTSRLGDTLGSVIGRQAGRGTAGIIFISDGITTSGTALSEAADQARRAAIPVHTVTLGRQFVQPDLRLVDLLVDREVYLGDQVTAEVAVVASDMPATTTNIQLIDTTDGSVLDSATLELGPERVQQPVRLSFVPDRPGEIPLEIAVATVAGESDLANNRLQVSVQVQDKTIRVLMVFQTASYEFRFLKSLLERTTQEGESQTASFEVLSVLQDADPAYVEQDATALRLVPSSSTTIQDIDVFVFGEFDPNLVSRSSQQAIFEAVTNQGAGCIFIYGPGSPGSRLQDWPLGKLLPIEATAPQLVSTGPQVGAFRWQPTQLGTAALPMQLAASPTESLRVWELLPRCELVSSVEQLRTGAQVLANAVDDASGRTSPVLITQFAGAGRTALQTTDETYRWTSFGGNDRYYQRYWGQMLRWLSRGKLGRDEAQSVLTVEPKQARLGQAVRFQLSLGSAAMAAPLPEPLQLMLDGNATQQRTLDLSRSGLEGATFQASVNDLPPGSYRAWLLNSSEMEPPTAEFSITAPPGEQANLRADLEAMQFVAQHSRGRAYANENAAQVFEKLPSGKRTRLGTLPPLPLWNSHWVALLFVCLLTAEWLLRRRVRML